MYSDVLFNFSEICHNGGAQEGAAVLSRMAYHKPFFGMDCGIRQDDIWTRVDFFKQCLELIEDDEDRASVKNFMHFSAGIMPSLDSVENRFEAVESLEQTILDFKDSGDEFSDRLVAIGACGIDHDWDSVEHAGRSHEYFDYDTIDDEKDLLAFQLTLAKKLDMPLILHSRKGFKETADVLKAVKWNKGVVHGFAYSQPELEFFLDLGWYISFSGTVTYAGKRNFSDMTELVSYVPKNRILVESDSPYYAPVPVNTEQNLPENIKYIYEYIASKRKITISKLCEIVDSNCKKLFNL